MTIIARIALCCALAVACGDGRAQPDAVDEWSVEEVMHIRSADTTPFGNVMDVALPSNDRVIVADGLARALYTFTRGGRFIRSAGRAGAGPTEFSGLEIITSYADSIIVHDRMAQRLTVMTADGAIARTVRVVQPLGMLLRGVIDDTLFVLAGPDARRVDGAGFHYDSAAVVLVGRDGTVVDTIARLPHTLHYGFRGEHPVFLAPSLRLVAAGDRYCHATGAEPAIECANARGGQKYRIEWQQDLRAIDDDVKREWLEFYTEHAPAQVSRAWLAARLQDVVWPERLPAISALLLERDGTLWVRQYRLLNEPGPKTWRVFGADGDALGRVDLPAAFSLAAVDGDMLWGVWRDSLDVTTVKSYRVRR